MTGQAAPFSFFVGWSGPAAVPHGLPALAACLRHHLRDPSWYTHGIASKHLKAAIFSPQR